LPSKKGNCLAAIWNQRCSLVVRLLHIILHAAIATPFKSNKPKNGTSLRCYCKSFARHRLDRCNHIQTRKKKWLIASQSSSWFTCITLCKCIFLDHFMPIK
jgi:hypothetical protein